jgi:hypothetical protein
MCITIDTYVPFKGQSVVEVRRFVLINYFVKIGNRQKVYYTAYTHVAIGYHMARLNVQDKMK